MQVLIKTNLQYTQFAVVASIWNELYQYLQLSSSFQPPVSKYSPNTEKQLNLWQCSDEMSVNASKSGKSDTDNLSPGLETGTLLWSLKTLQISATRDTSQHCPSLHFTALPWSDMPFTSMHCNISVPLPLPVGASTKLTHSLHNTH